MLKLFKRIYALKNSRLIKKLSSLPQIGFPGIKDIVPFLLSFFFLWTSAALFSFIGAVIPQDEVFEIERPAGLYEWLTVTSELLFAAYLEEVIFRFYIFNVLKNFGASLLKAVLLSSALFGVLHRYEGLLAVFYAFSAGILLSLVYIRTKSLHGIAAAHALYNFLVYIFS